MSSPSQNTVPKVLPFTSSSFSFSSRQARGAGAGNRTEQTAQTTHTTAFVGPQEFAPVSTQRQSSSRIHTYQQRTDPLSSSSAAASTTTSVGSTTSSSTPHLPPSTTHTSTSPSPSTPPPSTPPPSAESGGAGGGAGVSAGESTTGAQASLASRFGTAVKNAFTWIFVTAPSHLLNRAWGFTCKVFTLHPIEAVTGLWSGFEGYKFYAGTSSADASSSTPPPSSADGPTPFPEGDHSQCYRKAEVDASFASNVASKTKPLQKTIAGLEGQVKSLSEQLDAARAHIDGEGGRIAHAKQAALSAAKTGRVTQKQYQDLQDESDKAIAAWKAHCDQREATLNGNIAKLQSELEQAQTKEKTTAGELAQAKTGLGTAQERVRKAESDITALKTELAGKELEINQEKQKALVHQASFHKATQEIGTLKTQLALAEKARDEAQQVRETLGKQVGELQTQLTAHKTQVGNLQAQLDAATQRAEAAEKELEASRTNVRDLTARVTDLTTQVSQKDQAIERANQAAAAATQRAATAEGALEAATRSNQALQAALKTAKAAGRTPRFTRRRSDPNRINRSQTPPPLPPTASPRAHTQGSQHPASHGSIGDGVPHGSPKPNSRVDPTNQPPIFELPPNLAAGDNKAADSLFGSDDDEKFDLTGGKQGGDPAAVNPVLETPQPQDSAGTGPNSTQPVVQEEGPPDLSTTLD